MRMICIQFQPKRAKGLKGPFVTALMSEIAAHDRYVEEFTVQKGNDRGPYINFLFSTRNPKRLWQTTARTVLKNARISSATIVTCQGKKGWKDYFLLHHYDKAVQTERLSGV